jgi:hypothetical protein
MAFIDKSKFADYNKQTSIDSANAWEAIADSVRILDTDFVITGTTISGGRALNGGCFAWLVGSDAIPTGWTNGKGLALKSVITPGNETTNIPGSVKSTLVIVNYTDPTALKKINTDTVKHMLMYYKDSSGGVVDTRPNLDLKAKFSCVDYILTINNEKVDMTCIKNYIDDKADERLMIKGFNNNGNTMNKNATLAWGDGYNDGEFAQNSYDGSNEIKVATITTPNFSTTLSGEVNYKITAGYGNLETDPRTGEWLKPPQLMPQHNQVITEADIQFSNGEKRFPQILDETGQGGTFKRKLVWSGATFLVDEVNTINLNAVHTNGKGWNEFELVFQYRNHPTGAYFAKNQVSGFITEKENARYGGDYTEYGEYVTPQILNKQNGATKYWAYELDYDSTNNRMQIVGKTDPTQEWQNFGILVEVWQKGY